MSNLSRAAATPVPPTVVVAGGRDAPAVSPPIDVGATAPADGVGFRGVTPLAAYNPDRMQDVRSTAPEVPKGLDLDKTLAVIRRQESGSFDGDYAKAGKKGASASGAYQFTDGTWKELTSKYGVGTEYPNASSAPRDVQDAVMSRRVIELYNKHGGDMDKIYNTHFTGNARGQMDAKARAANHGLTAGGYLKSIRSHEADYDGRKVTASVGFMPEGNR